MPYFRELKESFQESCLAKMQNLKTYEPNHKRKRKNPFPPSDESKKYKELDVYVIKSDMKISKSDVLEKKRKSRIDLREYNFPDDLEESFYQGEINISVFDTDQIVPDEVDEEEPLLNYDLPDFDEFSDKNQSKHIFNRGNSINNYKPPHIIVPETPFFSMLKTPQINSSKLTVNTRNSSLTHHLVIDAPVQETPYLAVGKMLSEFSGFETPSINRIVRETPLLPTIKERLDEEFNEH